MEPWVYASLEVNGIQGSNSVGDRINAIVVVDKGISIDPKGGIGIDESVGKVIKEGEFTGNRWPNILKSFCWIYNRLQPVGYLPMG